MDIGFKLVMGIVITIIALTIFGIGYLIYDEVVSDKFYLRKDQWACTASHVETFVTYQKVGDIDVPITNTTVVCDQWNRR